MMKPYYSDEYVTLFLGDVRDVLLSLAFSDLKAFCWTDPPYNVGRKYNDSLKDEDYLVFCAQWIILIKQVCDEICVYPPRKYHLDYWNLLGREFKQIPLIWNTEGAVRGDWINQHAHLLTNANPKVYTKDWWHNIPRTGMGYFFRESTYGHPGHTSESLTNKIIAYLAAPDAVIIECFSGTGTTLKCAKDFNRFSIEISEAYCETAANCLSQCVLPIFA